MKFFREMSVRPTAEEEKSNTRMAVEPTKDRARLDGQLKTLDGVAQMLGVSKRHVQRLVQRKVIPVIRLGKRCTRFDLNRVLAAVKQFEIQEITLR